MSAPSAAVDDNPRTAWTPGPAGRMVVDLGSTHRVGHVELTWTAAPVPRCTITTSTDGRTYGPPVTAPQHHRARVALDSTTRYIAVTTPTWRPGQAALTTIAIQPT
nr:discoidin domain-containing protein [Saccharothrix deserti]